MPTLHAQASQVLLHARFSADPPNNIHRFRWNAMVRQAKRVIGGVIRAERYGLGSRWYCTTCDQYHNGHRLMIQWTNGTPPAQCPNCQGGVPDRGPEWW